MTWLAFILVCVDNMFLPLLCLIPCLLYALLCDLYVLVAPLHACFLAYTCICLLVCITKHCSKIWFRVGSHWLLYTKSRDPLLEALLVGTCVIHNSIQWIYGHGIQTYICPLRREYSLHLFAFSHALFVYVFVHMFYLFVCFHACLLCLVICDG